MCTNTKKTGRKRVDIQANPRNTEGLSSAERRQEKKKIPVVRKDETHREEVMGDMTYTLSRKEGRQRTVLVSIGKGQYKNSWQGSPHAWKKRQP